MTVTTGMRYIILPALALALLLALPAAMTPAHAVEGPFYITHSEVNLRKSPNGEIILVFDINGKAFVIERDGNWSHVSAPGREAKGWCWSEYFSEERIPVDASGDTGAVCEDSAIEVAPAPPPATGQGEGDGVVISDETITSGAPVEVVAGYVPDAMDAAEVMDTPQRNAQPAAVPHEAVTAGPEDDTDRLTVFSAGIDTEDADNGGIQRSADEFIPDPALIVPETAPLERPFTKPPAIPSSATVTTPAMLESAFYKPVGGHDIALIQGSNVNVRADRTLKSEILGRVDTGDKLYVIGYDDPWYHVSIPAKQLKGYVYGQYVSELPRIEITGTQVRLREKPDTHARIKAELNPGEVFYEFERSGKWLLAASSASGLKGWVYGEYTRRTERSVSLPYTVTGDSVNFRASPNVDAVILAALDRGTEVEVLGRSEKWTFINHGGQPGWMYSEYLTPVGRGTVVPGSPVGQRLIARAKAMAGTPYVWGGESDNGVDCSGLIYKLLLDEGADAHGLPRRASTQMAGLGLEVDKENLQPGDLVFFTTYKAGASHVGIYLGDGDFIHASSAQGKVTISNMSEGYYKQRFVGARRITEAELRK